MRSIPVLICGLMLLGCSDTARQLEVATHDLADAEQLTSELQSKLSNTRDTLTTRVAVLHAELVEQEKSARAQAEDYEQRLKLKRERIASLEKALREEKAISRLLRASNRPTARIQEAARETAPPAFPVEIFDVAGDQVIVSTTTRKRPVETEETYRDGFGNKQNVIEWEDVPVNQYEYLVSFSARNLTDGPVAFSVRAGKDTAAFTLRAGAVQTNLSVRSARGSGLMVRVGGASRRHDVAYLP